MQRRHLHCILIWGVVSLGLRQQKAAEGGWHHITTELATSKLEEKNTFGDKYITPVPEQILLQCPLRSGSSVCVRGKTKVTS